MIYMIYMMYMMYMMYILNKFIEPPQSFTMMLYNILSITCNSKNALVDWYLYRNRFYYTVYRYSDIVVLFLTSILFKILGTYFSFCRDISTWHFGRYLIYHRMY